MESRSIDERGSEPVAFSSAGAREGMMGSVGVIRNSNVVAELLLQLLGMGDCHCVALNTVPRELRNVYQFSAIIGHPTFKKYI